MSLSLSQEYTNTSGTTFNLAFYYLHDHSGSGSLGISTAPTPTLDGMAGTAYLTTYRKIMGHLSAGDIDAAVAWYLSTPVAFRFGVRLHHPKTAFGIGSDASWEVFSDNYGESGEGQEPNWVKNGKHSADPYIWQIPAGVPAMSIVARPAVQGSSISVTVTISQPIG